MKKTHLILEKTHLKESNPSLLKGNRFEVVLIQEGLGNLRDCFYYTKECLKNSANLFEGKKAMIDHPSMIEEESRPERSTRDIMGYYENVRYQESEDGRGMLVSELNMIDGPVGEIPKVLLKKAIDYALKYKDSDFVGFSINASGEADEIPIDTFIQENKIPFSVLEKMNEAKNQGIDTIRIVTALKEATSCDLVTEAGAGGKILKMIEQEKKPMEKNEMKQDGMMQKKEDDKTPLAADPQNPSNHADEEQDTELFKKLIQQYLGDDHEGNEEAMEIAKHAYEAHREKGMEHHEAYENAGKHLQMASEIGKRMAQKQKESGCKEEESECHKEDGMAQSKEKQEVPSSPTQKESEEMKKESNRNIKLLGQISHLKETLKKYELSEYLEKKLKESGKSNQLTKSFREALGVPKSKDQIDSCYKIFMAGSQCKEAPEEFGSFLLLEKNSTKESEENEKISFADCLS